MPLSDRSSGQFPESSPLLPLPGIDGPALGEALAWLDRHVNLEAIESGRAGALGVPGFERIDAILAALGDPQRNYPTLHVTGTNGKGSTTRICAKLLEAQGLSVGVYTSPHLERVNERLTVGDTEISDEELVAILGTLAELERFLDVRATWFELVTAAALTWFAEMAVDVAVVEVGLGGRYDSTNVVNGEVTVVTNVDLDHTEILGTTRRAIADEKAGIVKPGSVLVLGEPDPELVTIFEAEAARVGAAAVWHRGIDFGCSTNRLAVGGRVVDLWTPLGRYPEVFLPLHGAHQADNAACAVAAAQAFVGSPLSDDVVTSALSSVRMPGRLEVVRRRPIVLLDGAHNAAGAAALAGALAEDFLAAQRVFVVLGCLRGRDPAGLLAPLGVNRVARVITCRPPSPRAQDPEDVAAAADALGLDAEASGTTAEAIDQALQLAGPDDLVLVTGSLYVVGAARGVLV